MIETDSRARAVVHNHEVHRWTKHSSALVYSLRHSFLRSGRRESGLLVGWPVGDLFRLGFGLFALVATSTRP
jgi:hypothetical protein